jgi:hypothetical protein
VHSHCMKGSRTPPSNERLDRVLEQIESERANVNYSISDFTTELLAAKLDRGDIVIPNYQRALVWKVDVQSRFIESLVLGLPVPFLFAADVDGNLEIVDGTQRLRTVSRYLRSEFELSDLELLWELNGLRFDELPPRECKRLLNRSIRMIELSSNADLAIRFEVFSRINSGSSKLTDAEFRRGAFPSRFYQSMLDLAEDEQFRLVCPISPSKGGRGEAAELVLRFFAYADRYKEFTHDVARFLNRYLDEECHRFDALPEAEANGLLAARDDSFRRMVEFVSKYFPNGFRGTSASNTTPRVRFEAIAVGVHLALEARSDLVPSTLDWLESAEFRTLILSGGSNSGPRLAGRVEYVRDQLLQ